MKIKLMLIMTLFISSAVYADVCYKIDTTKDNLDEPTRNAANTYISAELQKAGYNVGSESCSENFTFYHVKLGSSVTTFMQTGNGIKDFKVGSVEELPTAYSRLISNHKNGTSLGSMSATRQNVTVRESAPRRVKADSIFYVKLGYGGVYTSEQFYNNTAIGFGYRYELDNFAVDFGFLSGIWGSSSDDYASHIKLIQINGLYYFDPISNNSLYLGGGMSYGGTTIVVNNDNTFDSYSEAGMTSNITFGYEMLRSSSIRFFAQTEINLPLYTVDSFWNSENKSIYAPSMEFSLGIGF